MRLLLILVLVCVPALAMSHQTGSSTLDVQLGPLGQASATLQLPAADLFHYLRLDPEDASSRNRAQLYLLQTLSLSQESGVCPMGKQSFDWKEGQLRANLSWLCTGSHGEVGLAYRAMVNDRFGYQHLGTVRAERVLTRHVFDVERDTLRVLVSQEVHQRNLVSVQNSQRLRQRLPYGFIVAVLALALLTWWWHRPPQPHRG